MAFEGGDGRLGSIITNRWRLGGGCLGDRRGTAPGKSAGGTRAQGRRGVGLAVVEEHGIVRWVMWLATTIPANLQGGLPTNTKYD